MAAGARRRPADPVLHASTMMLVAPTNNIATGALNITPASSFYTTLMELAQMLPK